MSDFNFNPQLSDRIKELNYDEFTDVQKAVFPHLLEKQNLSVKTGYGAGKTASFVLPVLHHILEENNDGVKAIILLPTRSLIYKVRKTIDMYTENLDINYFALAKGHLEEDVDLNNFDIIVTTVHNLEKFRNQIDFDTVKQVIIDEIDLMHYFKQSDDLFDLVSSMSNLEQTTIYSSRLNEEINRLIERFDDDIMQVSMDERIHELSDISHILYTFDEDDHKQNSLRSIFSNESLRRIVVFVDNPWTKKAVIQLLKNKLHVNTRWIDCDRENDFSDDIRLFMEGHYKVLILNNYKGQDYHLRDVNQIINYDFPSNSDAYESRCQLLSMKSVSYKDDAMISFSLYSDHQKKESVSNSLNISFKEKSQNSDDSDVVFGRVNKDRVRKIRI